MEQESKMLELPEPISDNVDRDWLLQHMVTHANQVHDFRQPITLWVGGGMISGVLVSGTKFFDEYIAEFVKPLTPEAAESSERVLRNLGKNYYEPDPDPSAVNTVFIHLLDAKLWTPSGAIPSGSRPGVIWRGRLSQVTGYSLGQIVAAS